MGIEIIDNTREVLEALKKAKERALEMIGLKAERYAKEKCPVDTGNLRNSITHAVDNSKDVVYIGTNVEYAPYVELGTGIYYQGGRNTAWGFLDTNGGSHYTHGQKPQPYLKPAATEHSKEYREILKNELSK